MSARNTLYSTTGRDLNSPNQLRRAKRAAIDLQDQKYSTLSTKPHHKPSSKRSYHTLGVFVDSRSHRSRKFNPTAEVAPLQPVQKLKNVVVINLHEQPITILSINLQPELAPKRSRRPLGILPGKRRKVRSKSSPASEN